MGVNDADGVRYAASAGWAALREQRERVLAESAEIRDGARQARSEAVEQRIRAEHGRFGRDNAGRSAELRPSPAV